MCDADDTAAGNHPDGPQREVSRNVVCSLSVLTTTSSAALSRVLSVLDRKLWTVIEMHHRREAHQQVISVVTEKEHGRVDVLRAALAREVDVLRVDLAGGDRSRSRLGPPETFRSG